MKKRQDMRFDGFVDRLMVDNPDDYGTIIANIERRPDLGRAVVRYSHGQIIHSSSKLFDRYVVKDVKSSKEDLAVNYKVTLYDGILDVPSTR